MESYLDRVESGDGASWQIFAKTVHSKMGFRKPAARFGADGPPSPAAWKYAQDLAAKKGIPMPADAEGNGAVVRAFLDQHAAKAGKPAAGKPSAGKAAAGKPAGKKPAAFRAAKAGAANPGAKRKPVKSG
jgi:hypothetical protein